MSKLSLFLSSPLSAAFEKTVLQLSLVPIPGSYNNKESVLYPVPAEYIRMNISEPLLLFCGDRFDSEANFM